MRISDFMPSTNCFCCFIVERQLENSLRFLREKHDAVLSDIHLLPFELERVAQPRFSMDSKRYQILK